MSAVLAGKFKCVVLILAFLMIAPSVHSGVPKSWKWTEAQSFFNRGKKPSAEMLRGKWVQLGLALEGSSQASEKSDFSLKGLTNKDGSLSVMMEFEQLKTGSTRVQFQNIFSRGVSHNPYYVSFNTREALISRKGFIANTGKPSDATTWEYRCRFLESDHDFLVCFALHRVPFAPDDKKYYLYQYDCPSAFSSSEVPKWLQAPEGGLRHCEVGGFQTKLPTPSGEKPQAPTSGKEADEDLRVGSGNSTGSSEK